MFSESSPCLLVQHASVSTAHRPVELLGKHFTKPFSQPNAPDCTHVSFAIIKTNFQGQFSHVITVDPLLFCNGTTPACLQFLLILPDIFGPESEKGQSPRSTDLKAKYESVHWVS